MTAAGATVQVVRPAGAGHETTVVLAACALILAVAGTVVSLRAIRDVSQGVAAHQVDARRDLSPAEQGLYADLRVALDEIEADRGDAGAVPTVAALAEWGLPPFVQDPSSARRGGHTWTLQADGVARAYVGLSADTEVAGSLLMRVVPPGADGAEDRHGHGTGSTADEGHGEPDVWFHRTAVAAPTALDDAGLTRAGWRQIAARFDAGVTRQRR